ncbi:MAG: SAM-dependent methyltransferase [Rhodospirillaceae bacterium]|nr:SAM-dependent methyltransferase [Rhodospirillaceae bacterium]
MVSELVVNVDQQQFWNEVKGDFWVTLKPRIDPLLSPFGVAALNALSAAKGERILDVGCGTGETSVELAKLVGPGGKVQGIDFSRPMLERARAEAVSAPQGVLSFKEGDAEVQQFVPNYFDAVFSRFGVMFFDDPVAALGNIRTAIKPGGRLAYVCWASRKDNPWIGIPTGAARQFLDIPPAPPDDAPGQFAMEREARIFDVLGRAGWSEVSVEKFEMEHNMGKNVSDAAGFICQMGPMSEPFGNASPALRSKCITAVEQALEPFKTSRGIDMKFSTWIVSAKNP